MARYDTIDLCDKIRRIESIPTSSNTFTDDDLAEMLNLELQTYVVPVVQRVREEYFVIVEQHTLTGNTLAIPPEAIGMRLRDVAIWNTGTQTLEFIPKLSPEELNHANRYGYTLRNEQIVFNNINSGTVIQLSYFKRPNDLTTTDYCVVVSKDGSNNVTVSGMPASWTVSHTVDVIGKTVPFITKEEDVTATIVDTDTLTLSAAAYAEVAVGDYIVTAGYSPVPQYLPVEAHGLLVQAAALRCLQSLGDRDGWKVAAQKLARMETDLVALISPRVETQYKKVITNRSINKFM